MEPTIALLANGRAHLKEPGNPLREVSSSFAKESQERQKRNQSIDGWKSRSGVWGNMGMAPPSMAQWDEAEGGSSAESRFAAWPADRSRDSCCTSSICRRCGDCFNTISLRISNAG